MASPQTKHGYARVANELLQAIYRFPFSGQELRVVLWVVRQSFGWSRRETPAVSVRELGDQIFMPPATVGWVTKGLRSRGILVRTAAGGWRLNKNYDEWLERGMGQLPLTAASGVGGRRTPEKKKPAPEPAAFKPPTLEEIKAYCAERKNKVDPEKFFHHYEATGWLTGKGRTPVTNWKSLVCYWERTNYEATNSAAAPPCPLCEGPLPYPGAIVCNGCGARCRKCNRETAQLKIIKRPDGTKTVQCAKGCEKPAPEARALVRAAVPAATRALDDERHERFMREHRRRTPAKENR